MIITDVVAVFKIRLHGEKEWERIATRARAQNYPLLLGAFSINEPEVKTEHIEISGVDGVLDFTDCSGIHYGMRDIEVELVAKRGYKFDYTAFKRKYLGQLVDFAFYDHDDHYYTGRVKISDNHEKIERVITLAINSDPFRYPLAGTSKQTIPSSVKTNILTADSFVGSNVILSASDASVNWSVNEINEGHYNVTIDNPASSVSSLAIGIPITPNCFYDIYGVRSGTGRSLGFAAFRASADHKEIVRSKPIRLTPVAYGGDVSGYSYQFFAPENCDFIFLEYSELANYPVEIGVTKYTAVTFDAGEKSQAFEYNSKSFNRDAMFSDGDNVKHAQLRLNSTWNPAFVSQRGTNHVAIIPQNALAGVDTDTVITFEKAVL